MISYHCSHCCVLQYYCVCGYNAVVGDQSTLQSFPQACNTVTCFPLQYCPALLQYLHALGLATRPFTYFLATSLHVLNFAKHPLTSCLAIPSSSMPFHLLPCNTSMLWALQHTLSPTSLQYCHACPRPCSTPFHLLPCNTITRAELCKMPSHQLPCNTVQLSGITFMPWALQHALSSAALQYLHALGLATHPFACFLAILSRMLNFAKHPLTGHFAIPSFACIQ